MGAWFSRVSRYDTFRREHHQSRTTEGPLLAGKDGGIVQTNLEFSQVGTTSRTASRSLNYLAREKGWTYLSRALRSLLKSECFGLSTSTIPHGYMRALTSCPSISISSSGPTKEVGPKSKIERNIFLTRRDLLTRSSLFSAMVSSSSSSISHGKFTLGCCTAQHLP